MRKPTRSISGVSAKSGGDVFVRVAAADRLVFFGMVLVDGDGKGTNNPRM